MNEGASVADLVNEFNSILSSWLGTVKATSGSTESTKLKFDNIRDLILTEDICRKTSREYSNSLLSAKDKGKDKKDKEVNMAVGDYDDALACCVGNKIDDRIRDFDASRWGCCPQNFFWYKLDSKGCYVHFRPIEERLGHMSEKGMKILASKGRIPDLQKAVVGFYEPCVLGKQKKEDPASMLPLSMTATESGEYSSRVFIEYCAENEIRMLKIVLEIPQQNDVAERMNRTLNESEKSLRLHAGLPNMFWEDLVATTAYLINHGPTVPLGFRIVEEEWQEKEVSLAHLRVFGSDSYVKNDQVVLKDSLEDLTNKSILAKRVLSSKITQSPRRSSDTSEGSENSGSFEDSRRSDEESKEEGSKTPLRRSTRESRALVRYSPSANYLLLIENEDLHLEQLDVKTTFLHSDLDEDIYMTQPEDFSLLEKKKTSCFYAEGGIQEMCYGPLLLLEEVSSSFIILLLYVDDMLVAGSDIAEIKKLKRQLSQEFEMKDLGSAKPNIAHEIEVVSRFMSNPGREHWKAIKWLLCYLKGTSKTTLYFSRKEIVLEGFSDLDYGGCLDSSKSTTGYVFTAGGITKILGAKNPADMLTKVVTTEKLKLCATSTGLRDN
nr:putative ribonuclease H-like domain, GAG-pre-integrase domain protein [Tanacetum cinerariifolium]